jgi:hypothetical protein
MEFEEDLIHMGHWLKGEFFDASDIRNPWKKLGKTLVNEAGFVFIMGYLRSTGLSKNKIMSNYPNWDSANMRIRGVVCTLNETLLKHYAGRNNPDMDFGLDLVGIKAIIEVAFDLVQATTLRALGGNENRRIRETTQTSTNIVNGGNNPMGDPTRPKNPLDAFMGR